MFFRVEALLMASATLWIPIFTGITEILLGVIVTVTTNYFLRGFTLIEMMIVIAIIAILVAIALPSYNNYSRRAHYTEVVSATSTYKAGVEECFNAMGVLNECDAGANGIPVGIAAGSGLGLVDSVAVLEGVITVTPKGKYGIKAEDTYVLTPTVSNDALNWGSSGGGVEKGYAN